MGKNILTITICLFTALLLCACKDKKQSAIDDLRNFTEELTANSGNYTEHDWEVAGARYEELNKRLVESNDQYTDKEQEEIGRLKARCFKALAQGAMNIVKDRLNDATHQMKGAMDEFLDGIDSIGESVAKE